MEKFFSSEFLESTVLSYFICVRNQTVRMGGWGGEFIYMSALWPVIAGGSFLCSDIFKWCHSAAGVLHFDGIGVLI